MWITEGALVVMKGLKQKSIYLLHDSIVTGAAATTSSSDIDFDTTKLWHMRLGHMSEKGMDMLCKQGLVGSKKKREAEFLRALCLRKSPSAVIDCKTLKEFDLKYGYADMVAYALSMAEDYAGDLDRRRSSTGYDFTILSCVISWKATLQTVVALSTTKVECIEATKVVKEAIWLKGLVGDLGLKLESSTVYRDS
ncbi:hypothetical protein RJ639_025920 [Escallonia herrerae]|uniref:GAG-pre-integrase domain-containing protein n=1 Tax=Escallonia herrerae TaxID=1293975 RepID=A0AA89ABM4_9ASTE|nr:hypothetical protein RJ639_025920 [Escallonia herrerae]